MGSLSLLFFTSLLAVGAYACQPPDCDHPDCGSCANACCSLDFTFKSNPEDVFNDLKNYLMQGGDDERYRFVNSTDYRPDNFTVKFQLQGVHTTKVMHYNDTLDFLIMSESPSSSVVKGFSISRIEGAYCDEGQNYKNLVGLIKGLKMPFDQKVVYGCTKM